ncbi:MAG: Membrane protein-like protein [Pedosphaera sp.]|nr:Membrane protein-like protein [Pedosphaera sp.]
MNESERSELEQLKQQQRALQEQLIRLNRALESLEQRLASTPETIPVPGFPQAVPQELPPLETPKASVLEKNIEQPAESHPIPAPPVIASFETHSAPVPEPRPAVPQPEVLAQASSEDQFDQLLEPQHEQQVPPFAPPPVSPEPQFTPPIKEKSSFEMRLGTYWLVRIGIVMLLTGLAFFGNYAYQNFIPKLGAAGKVGLLYLVSGALTGFGWWFQRKQEKLKNYAQVVLAGGLAAVYFTTYAAHHIPALQIIHNALLDGALLLGWAGFIIWLADRKKSEVLALFAVLLAYYTSVITDVGLFTLYSNLVLTAAAVFFLVRNRWATLSFASLVATYISYGFWRFYHGGQWHWASPEEGLWTGNYFLIGYWALFTAAVFLTRHDQFKGAKRGSFVSANNLAFFSAFILTMLQVRQGGFWKFSLLYGTILIAMSVLAERLFASDKILRNTYLTQGLLLVTLGFVTKYTGLTLSMVLAVEGVALTILSQQLKSKVLQVGSYVAAILAVAWGVLTIRPFDHNGLIIGSVVGALMLLNASWFRKKTVFETSHTHFPTAFFTILALLMWGVTTWQNTTPEWRGLVFAAESIVLLSMARPLGNRVLNLAVPAFASIGACWQVHTLIEQFQSVDLAARTGLLPAVIVGALMVVNAVVDRRFSSARKEIILDPLSSLFSGLALAVWLTTTFVFTPREYLAPLLAGEALVFTLSYYLLRLGELTLFGQLFLVVAQVLWITESASSHPARPWWNPALVIAITLAISQWWQRQKALSLKRELTYFLQGLYALAVVGLLYFWLQPLPGFAGSHWLAFTSLLAILISIYGLTTRSWLFVAAGQIFMVISSWQFVEQLAEGKPEWFFPVMPIIALGLFSFCTVKWLAQKPAPTRAMTESILQIAMVYRVVAVAMSLWWIYRYIPTRDQCWFAATIGLLLFLFAGWRRNQEFLVFSAIFTLAGVVRFLIPPEVRGVYWPDLFALLLIPIQQRIAKKFQDNYRLRSEVHAGTMILGGLCLWLFLSRWVLTTADGFYLTATWSGWALVLFIAGIVLRERVYRWLGLSVLACALGRVAVFDVWHLEVIYRILSFMALGIVLLVLGFLYNKYQEKIKEWL